MVAEHLGQPAGDAARGRHVTELSAALSKRGHDVTVYTRREEPGLPQRVRADGGYDVVRVTAGPARPLCTDDVVAHWGPFAEFLAEEWALRRPDVVHAHHWTSGLLALIGAHRVKVPVVYSYHGPTPHREGPDALRERRTETEALLARKASSIIAAGAAEVSELSRLGVRRTRISVVPSGVDHELFHPDGPVAERGLLRRVLVVGEPLPRNGLAEAEAVTALSTLDGVELVIAGGGPVPDPGTDQLRVLVSELRMRERVVFAGSVPRDDLPALTRSADVVLCVPWHEPFGTVALEAMACGVPVVAATVGVLPDIVMHQVTGLHVPPRDGRALAKALRSLLADETRLQEFGMAGRDRVVARYSWGRVAKEVLSVYERVASAAVRPTGEA